MKNFIQLIFWGSFLGFFIYLAYCLIIYIHSVFSGLPKEILAPIIAGLFTVFVSLTTVYLSKYLERKSSIAQEQRQKKCEIYQELIHNILSFIPSGDNKQPLSQDDMLSFFKKFTETVIIYGSDDVILAWSNWRKSLVSAGNDENDPTDILLKLENLLIEIRKDTGNNTKKIKQKDILRLFVNDIDNVPPSKNNK